MLDTGESVVSPARVGKDGEGDAFEASEMHDGARVVHRDKKVSRGMAALLAAPSPLILALAVFIAVSNGSSSKPLSPAALPIVVGLVAALGLAMALLAVLFGVLRTVITERAVHVKYGLWGPTILLEAIQSCKVVDYDWKEFGGWGIRVSSKGWAYVPSSGKVVEVVYREGGKDKRVVFGADNAEATAQAIERARGAKTRIAAGAEVDAESLAEAERVLDEERPSSESDAESRQKRA